MSQIVAVASANGVEVRCTIGPFGREPTDRQVLAATEAAEEMFYQTVGTSPMTSSAHIETLVSG